MKVALAQVNYTIGDIDGNTHKIINAIERAKSEGADLVLFAEQSVSGLPAYDLLRKNTFLELCEDAIVDIASHCDNIAAIVGAPILTSNGTISTAVLIQNRKVLKYVGKRNITARREMGFLSPASGYECAIVAGQKIAIVVGDDLSRLREFDESVETIISINARKYGRAVMARRFEALRSVAYLERKNIVLINQVGGGTDIVYDGTSAVFNKRGEIVEMLKSFEEDFAVHDMNIDKVGDISAPFESHNNRAQMLYGAACLGLKDFFNKSGFDKACLELSGGIDSSVVAAIAVAALGKDRVVGLIMPSEFSEENGAEHAEELAKNLGIEYKIVPITDSFNTIKAGMLPIIGEDMCVVMEENALSRIKMTMLMSMHNKYGYIVLNSTNKGENALGLPALYGDTAGAISITGDLYKAEIYSIAHHINKSCGDVIPKSILEKEPSSELHPDRYQTQSLPSYDVADAIIYRMIEQGQHREEIIAAGFECHHVQLIHKMIMQSEKKRFQYPPVLRLTDCSFGHERVMPLTHRYGDM